MPTALVFSFGTETGSFAILERNGLLLGYCKVYKGLKSVDFLGVFTGIALVAGDFDFVGRGDL